MKKVNTAVLNGFKWLQDDLAYLQNEIERAMDGHAAALGNTFIYSGTVLTGNAVSNGFVIMNNKLLHCPPQTLIGGSGDYYLQEVTEDFGSRVNDFSQNIILYKNNYAKLLRGTAPSGSINLSQSPVRFFDLLRTITQGSWVDVAHNAGNFTSNTGTWTVNSSAANYQFRYRLRGKIMQVQFFFEANSLSSSGVTELYVAIPTGLVAKTNTKWSSNGYYEAPSNGGANAAPNQGSLRIRALGGESFLRLTPISTNLLNNQLSAHSGSLTLSGEIEFEMN